MGVNSSLNFKCNISFEWYLGFRVLFVSCVSVLERRFEKFLRSICLFPSDCSGCLFDLDVCLFSSGHPTRAFCRL